MKNTFFFGVGKGGSVGRGGGLINFLPLKRGRLLEGGGLFERGGFIVDLHYLYSML